MVLSTACIRLAIRGGRCRLPGAAGHHMLARKFCAVNSVHASDAAALKDVARRILEDPGLAERLASTSGAAELLRECRSEAVPQEAKVSEAKEEGETAAAAPDFEQMKLYALHNFIPFIGFGFCDNAIMILCGDYVDAKLGLSLGITTMAAAAIGNTFSDVVGLWMSGFIETIALSMGLRSHGLTVQQMDLLGIRILKNTSMIVGMVLGCVLGMFPLAYPENWRIWASREAALTAELAARSGSRSTDL
eukprot:TRINITY_DN92277_c0_g1_i1.p1 TRINITY_DN92277_c0_g1~~TRINITY_DN92277_c0_g1_i1.p1  ORF type:complete len:259 (+),score=35.33 TRINITY_DN92277_c0_g1_i1:36-779(+)